MEGEEYSALQPTAAAKIESLPCPKLHPNLRKKKKNKSKRRFSDEQIRSLESMFESETKLEPRKKLQLARELGLQPRQVAIWFQNRRARWRSKQMEQDYRTLKANYDNLHSRFESLKIEKQSLLIQLQKLTDLLEKPHDQGSSGKDLKANSTSDGSDSKDTCHDFKTKPSCLSKDAYRRVVTYSDDDEGENGGYFPQKEAELMNMVGQVDGSLALPEKCCNFDSSGLFDQSCGSSNWWDSWS